ncbi:class A beta-lactamase [Nocardiopsis sp. NPDC058631]|uniref:class A beta-lactamase n=1 Tax=Nocardiopsis sp. NPDC058631 TaxID=3346566 RepID=UPI00364ED10F
MLFPTARSTGFAALTALVLVPATACAGSDTAPAAEAEVSGSQAVAEDLSGEFEQLETEFDARLGVYAVDTGTGEEVFHRDDERFGYASTHKAFSAALVLGQNTPEEMEEVITYTADDLVDYSPVTEEHVDTGMTLLEVADAAVRYSDNTAANLLFEELGGPDEFEQDMREIGDDVISADRIEPELNEVPPGETRDTSTPRAMAESLDAFVLGDVLAEDQRTVLTDMLVNNTTGDELIRAGVPEDWRVGDKTGGGSHGSRNDIAVVWPSEGDPIVIAVMSTREQEDAEFDNALISEATEIVVEELVP